MINAPHGYLWGPVGQVIFMKTMIITLQEEVIGANLGIYPDTWKFCMTLLVASHCLGLQTPSMDL